MEGRGWLHQKWKNNMQLIKMGVKKNKILMCKAVPFTSLCQYPKYNNYNNLIYILFINHHAHMNTDAEIHEYWLLMSFTHHRCHCTSPELQMSIAGHHTV
jgi:hypothetical protein